MKENGDRPFLFWDTVSLTHKKRFFKIYTPSFLKRGLGGVKAIYKLNEKKAILIFAFITDNLY